MTPELKPKWLRVVRWVIGLGVTGLSCWLLIRGLDWGGMAAALSDADYRWVGVGVLAIAVTFVTRSRRWQTLLWQSRVPFRPAVTAVLVGQVVNTALPMRSGDVVRATWVGAEGGAGTVEALGSIAVEKVWDLLALLACGLILLVWMPLPGWFAQSTLGTALTLLLVGGLILAALRWQAPLFRWFGLLMASFPAGWDQALAARLRRLTSGLEAIRQPQVSVRAFCWTVLTWAFGAVANLTVLAAFGIPSVLAALFLLVALMVAGKAPIPGQLGFFEGTCVVVLGSFFGVPFHEALAVGLVLHLVVMGPPLLTAALLLLWPGGLREVKCDSA